MKNLFSIGETAKINNVSIQALRLYDRMGLLKPSYINKDNGYRYYSIDQFIYIDIIKHAKNFGIPLHELKNTLSRSNMQEIAEKVREYQQALEQQIQVLIRAKERFSRVVEAIDYSLSAVQNQVPYVKEIEERRIVNLKNQQEVINFEVSGRLVENQPGLESAFESGYFVDIPSFLHNGEETYTSAYVAIIEDNGTEQQLLNSGYSVSSIPKGRFICITYNEQNKENKIKQLQQHLKQRNIGSLELIVVRELYDDIINPSLEMQVLQAGVS